MSSIWENSPFYLLTKHYVVWSFRQYFSKVIIKGEKHLPKKGPVIIAPNHLNALMDALAVLALPPHHLPKVFLARADLFKLPRLVVQFIRFAKILPAYRIRDGYDQLDRNKVTFEEAEQVLLNKGALGIMPEGNQGDERNIRPLVKGIFRIAFGAQQKLKKGKSVMIVPVGIEYGNVLEYQRTLIINIGHPIRVSEYMKLYSENQVSATNELKSTLRNALESLTVHVPTGENYALFDFIIELASPAFQTKKNPWHLFKARQEVAERLQETCNSRPEKMEKLQQLYNDYQQLANKLKFPLVSAEQPWEPELKSWQLNALITLQALLMIPGTLLNYLPYKLIVSLPRIAGIDYSGFFSSVYYGASIVVLPVYYLLLSALLAAITPCSVLIILLTIPLMYLSGKLSFRMYQNIRAMRDDLHKIRIQQTHPALYNSLSTIRQNIIDLLR